MRKKSNSPLQKKTVTNDNLIFLYCTVFITFGIISVIFAVATGGASWRGMLFHNGPYTDWFMDFFNSIRDSVASNVYSERNSVYPPLAVAFFRFMGRLLPLDIVSLDNRHKTLLQENQLCIMLYLLYALAVITFLYRSVSRYIYDPKEKLSCEIFAFAVIVSYPVMYGLERGNIVVMTVALTVFFVFFRNSENKIVREFSYIALAVAAGIKLYPAIFGVLLLFDKKYKQAVRLIVYGILAVVVPFILITVIPAPFQTSELMLKQEKVETFVENDGVAQDEYDKDYEQIYTQYTDLLGQELEPSDEVKVGKLFENFLKFKDKKSARVNLSSVSVQNFFLFGENTEYFCEYADGDEMINPVIAKIGGSLHPFFAGVDWVAVSYVFLIITEALAVFLLFVIKREWQRMFLICYLFLNVPSFSSSYALMFLIIPLVMFLFDEKETVKTKSDIAFTVLFALLMSPIPTFWAFNESAVKYASALYFNMTYNSKVNQLIATPVFQLIFIIIAVIGIKSLIKKDKKTIIKG